MKRRSYFAKPLSVLIAVEGLLKHRSLCAVDVQRTWRLSSVNATLYTPVYLRAYLPPRVLTPLCTAGVTTAASHRREVTSCDFDALRYKFVPHSLVQTLMTPCYECVITGLAIDNHTDVWELHRDMRRGIKGTVE